MTNGKHRQLVGLADRVGPLVALWGGLAVRPGGLVGASCGIILAGGGHLLVVLPLLG